MRRRAALAEHPFGTIKCRAGYRHFLVRGFNKVRGEWSLMALCYNFTRVLNIIGFDGFMAAMAAMAIALHQYALVTALQWVRLILRVFCASCTTDRNTRPTHRSTLREYCPVSSGNRGACLTLPHPWRSKRVDWWKLEAAENYCKGGWPVELTD